MQTISIEIIVEIPDDLSVDGLVSAASMGIDDRYGDRITLLESSVVVIAGGPA